MIKKKAATITSERDGSLKTKQTKRTKSNEFKKQIEVIEGASDLASLYTFHM